MSCYAIAAERGWLSRADAAAKTLAALRFFRDSDQSGRPDATGFKGFYYHFLDGATGARTWHSELSMIDTALLVAGALSAGVYFDAGNPGETELREVVDVLYRRIDWRWAQNGGETLRQGWKPECGFLHYGWEGYNEAIILYALALGSPTHSLRGDCYHAWTATYQWENLYGIDVLYGGPLFVHQFSHAWIDFRGIRDRFMREKRWHAGRMGRHRLAPLRTGDRVDGGSRHACALPGDVRSVALCEQLQSHARIRESFLGFGRQLRARSGHRDHDDRKLSERTRLAVDARMRAAAHRTAARGLSRRLASELTRAAKMAQSDDSSATAGSHDAYERARIDCLHPSDWRNPKPASRYDLLVIGSGPAGAVAAWEAASKGAKVALIERSLLGGNCLNTGCIPSKSLIRTSRLYAEMRSAEHFGAVTPAGMRVDFAHAMERVRRIRARMSRGDSAASYRARGIDVFFGEARFVSSEAVSVDGTRLRFRRALVATGARPDIPSIPGLVEAGFLTSENVFDLTELPRRLLVIGGGPLGCELAQAFCRFGSRTTIAQDMPLFLPKEERDAAQILSERFAQDGIDVRLNTTAVRVRVEHGEKRVDLLSDDYADAVAVDAILTGTGRVPNVERLDVDAGGIALDAVGGIQVDDFLRTSNPNVYAAGDVCVEHRYTHTADASARIAVHNALGHGRRRMSALTVPWCTYTDPEIAHVGLYVREARDEGIPVRTLTVLMHDVDRAITDSEEVGFAKIHVRGRSDRILGATIVARDAGDMINEITLAIVAGIGLRTLARVIHAYPNKSVAIKHAADAYVASLPRRR